MTSQVCIAVGLFSSKVPGKIQNVLRLILRFTNVGNIITKCEYCVTITQTCKMPDILLEQDFSNPNLPESAQITPIS